jgi:riboflavin synthase
MFTGLVEEVGTVLSMEHGRLVVRAGTVLEGTREGDSIAVNGACLTVVSRTTGQFSADVVPETLRRTNLGDLTPGRRVNLERALPADGRFGGHMVQGHIEGTGELLRFEPDGVDGLMAYFRVPGDLARYLVPKGFIALDGVSLTVVEALDDIFSVTLVPFTRAHTNLADRQPGDRVNLETDILARYLERLVGWRE